MFNCFIGNGFFFLLHRPFCGMKNKEQIDTQNCDSNNMNRTRKRLLTFCFQYNDLFEMPGIFRHMTTIGTIICYFALMFSHYNQNNAKNRKCNRFYFLCFFFFSFSKCTTLECNLIVIKRSVLYFNNLAKSMSISFGIRKKKTDKNQVLICNQIDKNKMVSFILISWRKKNSQ